jgi:hypothetical protein
MELRSIDAYETAQGEVLLYFPAWVTGAHHQTKLSSMWKVGRPVDYPHRHPTHWAPLPLEPALEPA